MPVSDNPSTDIVVAGHLCLDIIPTFPEGKAATLQDTFVPGGMTIVGPAVTSTGGPVSNTGLALHKLGIRTQLMGKVGNDDFGQVILNTIRGQDPNLASGMTVVSGEASSYSIVVNPPGVDRFFLHFPGTNDTFGPEDIRYDLLAQTRIFHFGYPPLMKRMYEQNGEELATLFRQAKETGVLTSLDMAMPDPGAPAGQVDWWAILRRTLPHVDVFLPSIEEMVLMLQPEEFQRLATQAGEGNVLSYLTPDYFAQMAEILLEMGAAVVGLKAGHLGLYLRTGKLEHLPKLLQKPVWAERELWVPCFRTTVVGTTGAGDATIAGFHAGLLQDLDPAETLTAAVAVGACNVEAADAIGGIIPWEQVRQRIAATWERLPLSIEQDGWSWKPEAQAWVGPADRLLGS